MDQLRKGLAVNIQRSDGRVHTALVSAILNEHYVSVEWFEDGETKGKTVSIGELLTNNPELAARERVDERANVTVAGSNGKLSIGKSAGTSLRSPRHSEKWTPLEITHINQQVPAPKPCKNQGPSKNVPQTVRGKPSAFDGNCTAIIRDGRRAKAEENRKLRPFQSVPEMSNANSAFYEMIEEYRKQLDYRPLTDADPIENHRICVCIRKRPMNSREVGKREIDVITIPTKDHVILHQPQTKVDLSKYLENQTFRFDYAFDVDATNEVVYRFTAQPLVNCIFEKGFATCFAYGQTGSGKTHTMGGQFNGRSQDIQSGIYAMAAQDVFHLLKTKYKSEQLKVSCSFFEIYSGKVFDLLSGKANLRVLEDTVGQVQIVGLKEVDVWSKNDVLTLIGRGSEVRTSGQTSANHVSSRSHAIFQIILRNKSSKKLHGKFSLIDLAGNERAADTMSSDRQTRLESAEINRSLLALKECIRALGRKNGHVPFRGSKLTLVLRDSFVGEKARTCMIALIAPGNSSCENTLNTLRYADRVKELATDSSSGAGSLKEQDLDVVLEEDSKDCTDLALIQSQNEQELSCDQLNFQIAAIRLQEAEENLTEELEKFHTAVSKWPEAYRKMYKAAVQSFDNKTEDVVAELRRTVPGHMEQLKSLFEKVERCWHLLNEEDLAAKRAREDH